jgi:cell division protein FtsW
MAEQSVPRRTAQASAPSRLWGRQGDDGKELTVFRTMYWLRRPAGPFYLLMGCTAILLALGLTMVLSSSSVNAIATYGSPYAVAAKQATWAAIGLPLSWVASRLPSRVYRRLAYPVLVVTLLLLLLVQVPGLGKQVNGSTNWLALGPITVQPSELAKLALVLWGADLLARKKARLVQIRHLVVPLVPVGILLLGLVLVGGDLGTSIVLVAILGALLFLAGAPGRIFAIFGATTLAGVGAMIALAPYRLARMTTFLNPSADPTGAGYQGMQSQYALASGGWWGVGLGSSREKWGLLPEAHTDFIFAVIGEELGLAGTLGVLAIFALLAYAGFRVAADSKDPFVQLAAAAATSWLMVQTLVNIGAVIGLVPITGIPLPLISYGGSALVLNLVTLGMLISFARTNIRARLESER